MDDAICGQCWTVASVMSGQPAVTKCTLCGSSEFGRPYVVNLAGTKVHVPATVARSITAQMGAQLDDAVVSGEIHVPPLRASIGAAAVLTVWGTTNEGELVKAVALPLTRIVQKLLADPDAIFQIDPRRWEEIVAATYDESGLFDRVILTPRSGDHGRDVIAERDGFGSIRLIESVKRYKPGLMVTADEVRAILGVLSGDQRASKALISTTSRFAPKVEEDPYIKPFLPTRLELVDGKSLARRIEDWTTKK